MLTVSNIPDSKVHSGYIMFFTEIFSISYTFMFKQKERAIASAVSIGEIPAGVTLGSILELCLNSNETFLIVPVIG